MTDRGWNYDFRDGPRGCRTQPCVWCGYQRTEHSGSDARRGRCRGYKAPDDDEGATGSMGCHSKCNDMHTYDSECALSADARPRLKDSGKRLKYDSGMVRDVEDDKPAFELMFPQHVPFDQQMVTRVAEHLRKGARKYTRRNWEKGNSEEECERAMASALRHMIQWMTGATDEDHAAAAIVNVIFAETMRFKIEQRTGSPNKGPST